jgi:hypothetical protein
MAYRTTNAQKILDLLKTNFGSALIKSYYYGDPLLIPEANLPAVCVVKESGDSQTGYTGFDRITENIQIRILLNKKDDIGASDDIDLTQVHLEQLIEGRDDTTNQYVTQSVMGVLRKNITFGNSTVGQTAQPEYGITPQADGTLLAEGHINIVVTENIQVSGRT